MKTRALVDIDTLGYDGFGGSGWTKNTLELAVYIILNVTNIMFRLGMNESFRIRIDVIERGKE